MTENNVNASEDIKVMSYNAAVDLLEDIADAEYPGIEEAPPEVIETMESEFDAMLENETFIKALAKDIEGIWRVNPETEDVYAHVIIDESGVPVINDICLSDYWQGASYSEYPYRDSIPVPPKSAYMEGEPIEEDEEQGND